MLLLLAVSVVLMLLMMEDVQAAAPVRVNCDPCIDRESYTVQAIVHGTSGDRFWQQMERSMRQSANEMRVQFIMDLRESFNEEEMAREILRAAQSEEPPDALIVTIPTQKVEMAIRQVIPFVPVFGLNTGYTRSRAAGLLGHVAMNGECSCYGLDWLKFGIYIVNGGEKMQVLTILSFYY
jgi:hypothetical protein